MTVVMESVETLQGSSDIPPAPPAAKGAIYALLVVLAITQLQRHYVHDLYNLPCHFYRRARRRSHLLLRGIRDSLGQDRQWRGRSHEKGSALASLPQKLGGISATNNEQSRSIMMPPGLGNLDSSCYQNSVIQALSSLSLFPRFVKSHSRDGDVDSMGSTLIAILDTLNNPNNAGQLFWLPPKLKNMSSWQQQDAQEYLSKVLEEVEGEISKSVSHKANDISLKSLVGTGQSIVDNVKATEQSPSNALKVPPHPTTSINHSPPEIETIIRDPLEGLMAQRVGCLQCGYSEGLSMTPFKCLTLSIREDWTCSLESCLDDFIALESITGVECVKCTLLQTQKQVNQHLLHLQSSDRNEADVNDLARQDRLLRSFEERLVTLNIALEQEDYSDSTLKRCQLPNKGRMMTIKTRQAVIARAPETLCIHINRSIFDERTGSQMKNTARLQFPAILRLDPWCLGHETSSDRSEEEMNGPIESWSMDPRQSLASHHVKVVESKECHQLKAVITHQGRHENGHYICYRRHSRSTTPSVFESMHSKLWWRFSDETVSEVDEDFVLNQGGVFMLFYEKLESSVDAAVSCNGLATNAQSECFALITPTNAPASQSPSASATIPNGFDYTDTQKSLSEEQPVSLSEASFHTDEISHTGDIPFMASKEPYRAEADENIDAEHCLNGKIDLNQRQTDRPSGLKRQERNNTALTTHADRTAKVTQKQSSLSLHNEPMQMPSDEVPTPPRSGSGSIGDGDTDFGFSFTNDCTPISENSNDAKGRIYPSPPASPIRLQP